MKQVMVTAVEKAELLEVDAPAAPLAADEVEGRTLFTAISAGTELHVYGPDGADKRNYPCPLGYAAVFEVEAAGAEARGLRPGDVVFTSGKHASRQRARAVHVAHVPQGLAPEKAVLTRLVGISWSTLVTARARPPAKVAVKAISIL